MSKIRANAVWAVIGIGALLAAGIVYAASTTDFSQTINAGTLTSDIRDSSRVSVSSPSVSMTAKTFSFTCLSGGSASTGTFGTNTQRIYVDNPGAANNGFTLTMAATSGITSSYTGGGSNHFDFNDPTSSGCTDGADADSYSGQLTVDPSGGTITTDYSGSSTTGISLGSSTAFNQGTTDSATLVTASSSSADVWRGYFTGIALSQTIPAEQAPDTYILNLTVTVTAS